MAQALRAAVHLFDNLAAEERSREKLVAYRKLRGLRAYWIVSQDAQRIEVHQRNADGLWTATAYGAGETLPEPLPGAGTLAVAAVYAGTDLA